MERLSGWNRGASSPGKCISERLEPLVRVWAVLGHQVAHEPHVAGAARDHVQRVLETLEIELRDHARDLGSESDLDGVIDLIERGNGAERQLVVYEANRDFTELMREIVEATVPE